MGEAWYGLMRARLRNRLRSTLDDPVVERKELAAFDIVMSRRDTLKHLGVVGTLVAAGAPPTTWGRHTPELAVAASVVGLTPAEQASVNVATQLSVGSELFHDTVYAQPVVSPEAVGSHAVIESARGRLRLQSDLTTDDPAEGQFLDTGYHFGPPELLQLETTAGGPVLTHYFHPWASRSDGAATDGMDSASAISQGILSTPQKVVAATSTSTNAYQPGDEGQQAWMAYAAFVEDPGRLDEKSGRGGGVFGFGHGNPNLAPPYQSVEYPVTWNLATLEDLQGELPSDHVGTYAGCDRYVASPYAVDDYDAEAACEHLVLYFDPNGDKDDYRATWIISVFGNPDKDAHLVVTTLKHPADTGTRWRVVDVDWNPASVSLTSVTLATTFQNDNGHTVHRSHTYTSNDATKNFQTTVSTIPCYFTDLSNDGPGDQTVVLPSGTSSTMTDFDFSTLTGVHTLFTEYGPDYSGDASKTQPYQVALGTFGTAGLATFVLGPMEANVKHDINGLVFDGLFPVTLPDDAGVGEIATLTGGVSKFGGFRYVASDEDGNVFMLRQRRLDGSDLYEPPIYGPFDANGTQRTSWSATAYDALPSGTAGGSPLGDLRTWSDSLATVNPQLSYNLLLSALAGFGTTPANLTQGTWLGNGFQAAYALSRFNYDSTHVVVKAAPGSDTTYSAYTMFANPVTKAWHQRLIATQTEPAPPGENDSGDFFQATVTPVNAYGQAVPVTQGENADLVVEVRADAPTMVTDQTHNLYYDVDQYSSFLAAPDPASGALVLVVKAENFAQQLYLRPVYASGLAPTSSDTAMLAAEETVFPWIAVNISSQAQQRMGNTSDGATSGDLVDTTVYVQQSTVQNSATSENWQFKQGYGQDPQYDSIASYLNTSGQNMLQVGAATTSAGVDPVTSPVTPVSGVTLAPGTTTFAYAAGTVTHTTGTTPPQVVLGDAWSSMDHALHDALHWLQHVAGKVYSELAGDGVQLALDTESITVTISSDIMKQVTGVGEALSQAVDTVEEYASVVVNVLVTIVEESFVYEFIELLIALVSLWLYLEDIESLSHSLRDRFRDIVTGTNGYAVPTVSSGFATASVAEDYLGPGSQVDAALGGVDTSGLPEAFPTDLLNDILSNPLTNKILTKVVAEISRFVSGATSSSPLGFEMDGTPLTDAGIVSAVDALADDVIEAFAQIDADVAEKFLEGLDDDVEEPQAFYENLATFLGPLTEAVVVDALDDVFAFADTLFQQTPQLAADMIDGDTYVTLKIPMLADLCKLFGIGSPSGNELKLSVNDAVFFPMALVIWVSVYMRTGKSVSSVGDLGGTSTDDEPGAGVGNWGIDSTYVDLMTGLLANSAWILAGPDSDVSASGKQWLAALQAWLNLVRWSNRVAYTFSNPGTVADVDKLNIVAREGLGLLDAWATLPGKGYNPGAGWPDEPRRTDITATIAALLTIADMGYDSAETGSDAADVFATVGKDLYGAATVVKWVYALLQPGNEELFEYAAALALFLPAGLIITIEAESGAEEPAGNTGPPGPPSSPPGRPDQPGRSDPPGLEGGIGRPDRPGRSDPPGLSRPRGVPR